MKALSLTQPWATLIAIGAKGIETRSWQTSHRGLLAIHAAKGMPDWAKDICHEEPFRSVLLAAGIAGVCDLPRGAVIATAHLVDCVRTEVLRPTVPKRWEIEFGDYGDGRFGWLLERVVPFPKPIPATGARLLWEWEGPPKTENL